MAIEYSSLRFKHIIVWIAWDFLKKLAFLSSNIFQNKLDVKRTYFWFSSLNKIYCIGFSPSCGLYMYACASLYAQLWRRNRLQSITNKPIVIKTIYDLVKPLLFFHCSCRWHRLTSASAPESFYWKDLFPCFHLCWCSIYLWLNTALESIHRSYVAFKLQLKFNCMYFT